CETKLLIHCPKHGGQLFDQNPQSRFTFPHAFIRALSLDRKRDLAANRRKKLEIAIGIDVLSLVILDDQDPDRCRWCPQRNSEPGWRRCADEFDVSLAGKPVEHLLGYQHRPAGVEHVAHAAPVSL